MRFDRGTPIRLLFTKWGDRPHWDIPGRYLGSDEYGDWCGFPTGTYMSRPELDFTTVNEQVGLIPRPDLLTGGWAATFHGPGGNVWTYVDMTTVPSWDGTTVSAVDLDLDVIEALDRTVFVDDEDEFAEHQVELGYPAEVVALAEASRDAVLAAVRDRTPPFDGSAAAPWFDVLHQLGQ